MGQKIKGKEGKMAPANWRAKEDFLKEMALDSSLGALAVLENEGGNEGAEKLNLTEELLETNARGSIRALEASCEWDQEAKEFELWEKEAEALSRGRPLQLHRV